MFSPCSFYSLLLHLERTRIQNTTLTTCSQQHSPGAFQNIYFFVNGVTYFSIPRRKKIDHAEAIILRRNENKRTFLPFLAQLSRCAYTITLRKPYSFTNLPMYSPSCCPRPANRLDQDRQVMYPLKNSGWIKIADCH